MSRNYIYAVKFDNHLWHYFEEVDSVSSVHGLLPAIVDKLIGTLDNIRAIQVPLDNEISIYYFDNGKFIFNGKQLKTYLELVNLTDKPEKEKRAYTLPNKTTQLIFNPGYTNPLLFLNKLEKCIDMKTEKDKMFVIRNFVHEDHRSEFNQMYYTSDWPTVRQAFLKKYSLSYTENMKRELNINFDEETSLRSFVERKLSNLSTYTTLPLLNQMEMVLMDLPAEISYLFILNEKMSGSKTDIFDFCDSIQDLASTIRMTTEEESQKNPDSMDGLQNEDLNRLEIFNFDSNMEPYQSEPKPSSSGSKIRGAKRGRPPKKIPNYISNDDSSSQWSNSETDESMSNYRRAVRGRAAVRGRGAVRGREAVRGKDKAVRGKGGKITKRGRPQKILSSIPEEQLSDYSFLNEITDTTNYSSN